MTAARWGHRPDRPRLATGDIDPRLSRGRRKFVTSRAMLRHLPGGYLQRVPAGVEFGYNRHGKPRLIGQGAPPEFNVSHSSDAAVSAFSRARAVGVDVEAIRGVADSDGLAERFCNPAAAQALRTAAPVRRGRAFCNCRTRKKAFTDAVGGGLRYGIDSFEVKLAASDQVRVQVSGNPREAEQWTLNALPAESGDVRGLAVRRAPRVIRNLAHGGQHLIHRRGELARSRCLSQ